MPHQYSHHLIRRSTRLLLILSVLAALATATPKSLLAQETSDHYSGTLEILWGDLIAQGAWLAQSTVYRLALENGERILLENTPELLAAGDGAPLRPGMPVTIRGQMTGAGTLQVAELVANPSLEAAAGDAAIQGSYPWVALLCQGEGANIAHEEPLPYYSAVLGGERYGLDHYWREVSYNKANIMGSAATGWLPLPDPASAYQIDYNGGVSIDLDKSLNDCTAAADALVDFTQYKGIALFVPVPPVRSGNGIWYLGGGSTLKLDGVRRFWSVVWMPTEIGDSWQEGVGADVLAHEMGHGFGLPHSSGPYGATYDSVWDVMSMSGGQECYQRPVKFACAGQHTIAVHKEWLGWLNTDQVVTLADKSSAELLLHRLAQPAGYGAMLIKSPIAGKTRYYTVEARKFVGYDERLSDEAVVIHDVNTGRSGSPAQVVDPDGNGDPNDEGAQWEPGERFSGLGGFELCVKAARPEGFVVQVARNQALNCTFTPDLSASRLQAGTVLPSAAQTVTVQIDLVNFQTPANNVVVTATVPPATTYVSRTATTTQGSVTLTNTNQLVFRVGSLTYDDPVVLTYDVVVNAAVTDPAVIVHAARVVWDGGASTLQMTWVANARRLHLPLVRQ